MLNGTQIAIKQPILRLNTPEGKSVPVHGVVETSNPMAVSVVKDSPGRPVYTWKTGKTMFLSARENLIAEEFLASRSYASCVRKLKSEMGYDLSPMTVMRWLKKPHIEMWLGEQMEERGIYAGWSKERWMLKMTEHLNGKDRLKQGDLFAMSLIAKHKGWGSDVTVNQQNMVLNFTERA